MLICKEKESAAAAVVTTGATGSGNHADASGSSNHSSLSVGVSSAPATTADAAAAASAPSSRLESDLLQLLRQADAPIPLTMLSQRYLEQFGRPLNLEAELGEVVSDGAGGNGAPGVGGRGRAGRAGGSVSASASPVIGPVSQQSVSKLLGLFKGTATVVSR